MLIILLKMMSNSYKIDHGVVPDEPYFMRMENLGKGRFRLVTDFSEKPDISQLNDDGFFKAYHNLNYTDMLYYNDEMTSRLIGVSIKQSKNGN